jgi:hypothetical protein
LDIIQVTNSTTPVDNEFEDVWTGLTYSLGFFLGPGLPRALGPLSSVLFVPALAPDPFFFRASPVSGTGVALLSEASPLGEVAGIATTVGTGVGVEIVDGVDFAFEFFRGVGFGRKRPRIAAGSLKTTILLDLSVLSRRPF